MGRYRYRALDANNEKIEGKYEAKSKEQVMNYIAGNGMYPLMVEEIIQSRDVSFGNNRRVKVKDISVLCRQFYTMLNAGVPILECLSILGTQIENNKLRNAINEIEADVNKGAVLSESIKKHPKIFPALFNTLVASGEASGKLDTVMLRMSTYYEKQTKTGNKVKNAMIYPIILIIVALLAVNGIMIFVMPTFITLFDDPESLPGLTKFMIFLSNIMVKYWYVILGVMIALIVGTTYYLKTDSGKMVASKIALSMPGIKKLNQMSIVSQFTRTMATLISSGIPLIEALDISKDVVGNVVAKNALSLVNEQVSRGESLYYSIEETGIFPNMLCSMVKIGEETGDLDGILNKTADFYDEELDTVIQSTIALLEPIMILFLGVMVGFIVASVMLPMFDSFNQMM